MDKCGVSYCNTQNIAIALNLSHVNESKSSRNVMADKKQGSRLNRPSGHWIHVRVCSSANFSGIVMSAVCMYA